jgi:hypothetical protein
MFMSDASVHGDIHTCVWSEASYVLVALGEKDTVQR